MGDFLTKPNTKKESEDSGNSFLKYGASGMQGWRLRMEDSHISAINLGEDKQLHIFGVFDGHGGKEVAQFVKKHFVAELWKNNNYQNDNLKDAWIETFLQMDNLMTTPEGKKDLAYFAKKSKEEDNKQDKENNKKQKNKMAEFMKYIDPKDDENCNIAMITGCTACVCAIDQRNHKMYFVNAGDSRAVLCKNNIGFAMTLDHKPDLFAEKNRIYLAEGWVNEGRIKGNLNLSRSWGDLEYKQNEKLPPNQQMISAFPDVTVENYSRECEFIVIGCDGIWDCLTNQEACDYVKERLGKEKKLSKIVENMMDSIISKDLNNESGVGCDNMTCVIIQFMH